MRRMLEASVVAAALASAGPSWSQDVNDTVYDSLKAMIASEVLAECKAGSHLTESDGTYSIGANGNLIVRMGGFDCDWAFTNHFFCGARACETREYAVSGSDVRLVKEYLE